MACKSFKLSAINTSCGSNVPSLKNIWVGAFDSVEWAFSYVQVPDPENPQQTIDYVDEDGNKVIESITGATLKNGEDLFVEFGFRKNTCSADTEMTVNDNGSHYFTNSVNMVFAKQDAAKRLNIQALASGDCTVLYKDGNNIVWVIGVDAEATLETATATTGTAVSDNNQYELTISETSGIMPIPVAAAKVDTVIAALTTA